MAGKGRRRVRRWLRKRSIQNWIWLAAVVLAAIFTFRPHRAGNSAPLDDALTAGGFLLIGIGIWIRVCARGWKYEGDGHGIVMDGLYGYVRHPLYLGSFTLGLGLCAIAADPVVTAVYVVSFWISHGLVLRGEEAYLASEWPEQFARFRANTAAVFPRPSALLSRRPVLPRNVWDAILREADAVCLWPLIGLGLELWKEMAVPDPDHSVRMAVLLGAGAIFGIGWAALRWEWSRSRRA